MEGGREDGGGMSVLLHICIVEIPPYATMTTNTTASVCLRCDVGCPHFWGFGGWGRAGGGGYATLDR